MDKYFSIKIPEPCHQGWDTMSPREKGRFCGSCNKTVVDFTKMDTYQIQDFLIQNKDQRICGHIKQSQLDSINLRIPLNLIQQKHNVYKSFFLAAMIVMGTSLFSCSSKSGQSQKIDSIEVVDTTKNEVIDLLGMIELPEKTDSTILKKGTHKQKSKHCSTIPLVEVDGMIDIITTGEVIETPITKHSDSLIIEEPDELIEGDMIMGFMVPTTQPFSFESVEKPPKFKDTPQNLSKTKERKYFQNQLGKFVKVNFDDSIGTNLGLKPGIQRVFINFEIEENGAIKILRIRAPHIALEKEARRVMEKLPKFIPAENDGKPVSIISTLPIIFKVED